MELPQQEEDHGIHLNDEGRSEGETRYSFKLIMNHMAILSAYSDDSATVRLRGLRVCAVRERVRLEIEAGGTK